METIITQQADQPMMTIYDEVFPLQIQLKKVIYRVHSYRPFTSHNKCSTYQKFFYQLK
jgi:hypothetical protein